MTPDKGFRHPRDSCLRRKRIEHLCDTLECSLLELKNEHPDLLSNGLRCQINYMIKEKRKA